MRSLLTILFGLLAAGLVASAATVEYRYQNGACAAGSAGWWSVTTITDGVPTHITGRDCDGKLYDKDLPRRVVSADPIAGLAPTFAGTCGGASWRIVILRDEAQYPIWMAGQDCAGEYWVIDDIRDPSPGDGLN
jgi:hypothetical protein